MTSFDIRSRSSRNYSVDSNITTAWWLLAAMSIGFVVQNQRNNVARHSLLLCPYGTRRTCKVIDPDKQTVYT
jgi:hypothetical protein